MTSLIWRCQLNGSLLPSRNPDSMVGPHFKNTAKACRSRYHFDTLRANAVAPLGVKRTS
jgi:hypothetical protein